MIRNSAWIVIAIAVFSASVVAETASSLRVYLPRQAQADGDVLSMGSVCVLRSDDDALLQKASSIALGRAPVPREEIVIDRNLVLSRLASKGISAKQVSLSGADSVKISRDETVFTPKQILDAARKYLSEKRPGPDGCGWKLIRSVRPISIGDEGDAKLVVRPTPNNSAEFIKLQVVAKRGRHELASRTVQFRLTYPHKQAVVKESIAEGEPITKNNTEIRTVSKNRPQDRHWSAPFGKVAARSLAPGVVLNTGNLRDPKATVLVERNDIITMSVKGPGFLISGKVISLQKGCAGDMIKVRNMDSKRVVVARVRHDGSVEPTAER